MKKDHFDIQLLNSPVFGYGNAQCGTDGGGFDNKTESVIKIKAMFF